MKKMILSAAVLLISSVHFMASAQDATKPAVPKAADKPVAPAVKSEDKKTDAKNAEEKKTEEKKSTNRLPSNYGKLGLTDAQKSKVYGIQDKHEKEIDGLAEKLKAAKAKRDIEIEAILTPDQKKTLKQITSTKDEEKEEVKEKK